MVNTATFIRRAEELIKANPQLLEDELYPDVKKVYREHYRKKKQEEVRVIEVVDNHYTKYSAEESDLDAVGGDEEALCNIIDWFC